MGKATIEIAVEDIAEASLDFCESVNVVTVRIRFDEKLTGALWIGKEFETEREALMEEYNASDFAVRLATALWGEDGWKSINNNADSTIQEMFHDDDD